MFFNPVPLNKFTWLQCFSQAGFPDNAVAQLSCFQPIHPNLVMCFCVFLDSERSHLSSFTMKLKGKFHSPKIKRTPSKKGKQADLTVKTPEKSANKVSKWRASSPRLAGFLLSVTQVLRSTASLSVCDFVLCRSLQICQGTSRCLMVSFKLCCVVYSKRCIFFLSC